MKLYFAPMEGVTDHIFRGVHHRCFGGADKYYTPFFSPTNDGRFPPRDRRDFDPDVNEGMNVVPQLLTKYAEDFLWAARVLAELGFREVNLNVGCPSGTVTAKGKGSGLLTDLASLERLLDGIFAASPLPVSVKTRLGWSEPEELARLLELFGRYPICELTVHCRVKEDLYKKPARPWALGTVLEQSPAAVCYNGDLFTAEDVAALQERFPTLPAAMLGRGAIADPALFRQVKGGARATREELAAYTDALFEGYCQGFGSPRAALGRMKEIWFYLSCLFEQTEPHLKKLRKSTDGGEYRSIVSRIFGECPLRAEGVQVAWQSARPDFRADGETTGSCGGA